MDWTEEYKRKLVSPEEAAKAIKSGERIAFSGPEAQPKEFCQALVARMGELEGVEVCFVVPRRDAFWSHEGWERSFRLVTDMLSPISRPLYDQNKMDIHITTFIMDEKPERQDVRRPDVYVTQVSPPDRHGFCSFGASLFDRREQVMAAKKVIAQVNEALIRTYGENYVHVSDIDYFIEAPPRPQRDPPPPVIDQVKKNIAEYVSTLIRDGDTIEVGVGDVPDSMPTAGVFRGKQDLGLHTEVAVYGIVRLVKEGLFTGRFKTIHKGKAVATAFNGTREDLEFINGNPIFELYSCYYTHDIRTIAAHDNMVAINGALTIDLTGQISAESIGPRYFSTSGGQPAFAVGALASKGGRFVTILQSTAAQGKVSRIVPMLEPGTVVTVPRTAADHVVTEYGVARLLGKTQRERAEELIAIAHPDFRGELREAAKRLFYP